MAAPIRYSIHPPVYQPRFPLPAAPLCLDCGNITHRRQVTQGNPIGNAGRWYYVYASCKMYATWNKTKVGWSTWDDGYGIHESHPSCNCGHHSRLDRARNGKIFWTCATGGCRYHFWKSDDFTDDKITCPGEYVDFRSSDKSGQAEKLNEGFWNRLMTLWPKLVCCC